VGSETPTVNDVTDRAAKDLTENRSLDAETRATLMRSIGQVYVTQNRFAEARPLLEESVDLFRNNPELSRVRYGRSLMRFSQLENYEGNYEESFRLAREAEHAVIEGGAGQAPIRGVAASILGANLLNGRQRDESREASTRAVDVFRSHGAEYERELATALMNLARCTEDAVQAAGFATEAIELYERTLPADHPGRAEGPKFLADQNYYLGDYATAAKYQGQAVEALRRLLPLDHWNVVFPVRIQAAYLLFAQQLEPARAALEEVAEAVIAASGESDIRLGGLYNDLAFVGLVEGDFEAAEAIARRSREILEAVVGREHLDVALTIHTLADILADRGEHDAALTLYDETRRIRETLGDLNSDPYAPALYEAYARLHRRTGELQRAEKAIRRAIELYEQSLYIDTRVLPRARVTAATIRALLGDREGAAEAFDAAWSALAEAPGPLTMYDARQLTLYHAVNGDPVALAAALRTALDSGARPAFLLTEPELARRVRGDLALVALLTDD
jgi:tetratricopeptide (TPR) repeat protein